MMTLLILYKVFKMRKNQMEPNQIYALGRPAYRIDPQPDISY